MQKHPNNGTLKIHNNNIISLAATKPPIAPVSSNIPTPTQKLSNNFQQTLPRYNPPPNPTHNSNSNNNNNISNNNQARKIIQRGRYSTGTASSLIPTGNFIHHQTPLASPALSTTSTAISAAQDNQKSHPFPSRLLSSQDMLKFQVRKNETENQSGNNNAAVPATSTNAQIQSLIAELRALKEANARLMDDNQELRDLCCFLDDDRQKGRKLAREWNRFGKYTASVMRSEVQAYQNKLRQLDEKQQELIRDNLELKELCLYLDEERTRASIQCSNCGASNGGMMRDDGDGSSSSTNADEPAIRYPMPDFNLRSSNSNAGPQSTVDQTIHYVRSLENKIRELEGRATDGNGTNKTPVEIFRALKLLEVREQLDRAANAQQNFKEA